MKSREAPGPSPAQVRLFFDAVPCPAWLFDEGTLMICASNRAASARYGYSREEFVAMTMDALGAPAVQPALRKQLRRSRTGAVSGEVQHVTKTGRSLDVVLRWVRSGAAAGDTGMSLAWAEVREADTPAAPVAMPADAVFTLAPVPLMSLDQDGVVRDVNGAAANLLREARADLIGRPFAVLIADAADDIPAPDRLGAAGEWSGPITLRRADGSTITTEARTARRSDGLRVLALQDVSERVRTEGELRRSNEKYRRLSDHSRHVREEERARLSRDLHDRLGQALTGLKMDLAWLLALCDRFEPTTARSAIAVMMDRIDTTIGIVRRIAGDLRPGVLDRLGLQAAIEWRAAEFERRSGVRCRIATAGSLPELDRLQSTELFRVFEEILTNVARHANARLVRITMKGERGKFALHVYDNGRGIPLEAVDSEHSLGLIGMRERATLLGGTVTVSRGRRRGTLAVVRIPIAPRMVARTVAAPTDVPTDERASKRRPRAGDDAE